MAKYACQQDSSRNNLADLKKISDVTDATGNPGNSKGGLRSMASDLYGVPEEGRPQGRFSDLKPMRTKPL